MTDLDLYVTTPGGETLSFQNTMTSDETGVLDRDNTEGGSGSVENISFSTRVPGSYEYWVVNFAGSTQASYTIRVFEEGQEVDSLSGTLPAMSGEESTHAMHSLR